jgi:hypothetical protein
MKLWPSSLSPNGRVCAGETYVWFNAPFGYVAGNLVCFAVVYDAHVIFNLTYMCFVFLGISCVDDIVNEFYEVLVWMVGEAKWVYSVFSTCVDAKVTIS